MARMTDQLDMIIADDLGSKILTELRCVKTDLRVSDLVRHKLAFTVSEDGEKIEISDLGRREIVLSEWQK